MAAKHKSAFTLVELLMSLVILGMLMAAVAVAFDASVKNYQDNQGIYRTTHAARQTLLRLTHDIRTANNVDIDSDDDNDYLSLTTPDDPAVSITYRLHRPSGILYLKSGADEYVLCRNISAMNFTHATVAGHPDLTRNVRIVLTVTDADSGVSQTLAAAAVVRRNL